MTNKTTTTTIVILGKEYPIRCLEDEAKSLQMAAELLDRKMQEVQDSGKAINLERIAIITALNMAHQLVQVDSKKGSLMQTVNERITRLQQKVEEALNNSLQTELIYSNE